MFEFSRAPRLADWPQRLFDVVVAHERGSLVWGQRDCATFFDAAVAAVVGRGPLEGLPRWDSERAALRTLAASGAPSVLAFVETHFDEIVPADARRGDLGFCNDAGTLACPAVITGAEMMSFGVDGRLVMPRGQLVRAFMVGR